MLLAEALKLKSDIDKRLQSYNNRIREVCKVQEGDEPQYDINELIQTYESLSQQLRFLSACINLTNSKTFIGIESNSLAAPTTNAPGRDEIMKLSITEALATKEILKKRRTMYGKVANCATIWSNNYSKTEIKIISVISPKKMQEKVDELSQALRILETKIQEQNWLSPLKDLNGDDYLSSDLIDELLI